MNSINFSVSLVSTYPKWYNPLDNQQTLHLQPKRREKKIIAFFLYKPRYSNVIANLQINSKPEFNKLLKDKAVICFNAF